MSLASLREIEFLRHKTGTDTYNDIKMGTDLKLAKLKDGVERIRIETLTQSWKELKRAQRVNASRL
jgi:hypothetical protein